jgi:hypothetical protein
MPKIKVNDKDYDTDALPEAVKQQLQMLAVTDAEIKRLQTQVVIAQTAKNAYAQALAAAVKPTVPVGDTVKLG